MEKAFETLEDSGIMLEKGHLHSCVNRIYYSVFYAVNALLIRQGLYSIKHSGVLSLFQKEFVKTGVVDKDKGDFYLKIFKKRQKGDYDDFAEFEKGEVKKWLKEAEIFVEEIKKVIKDIGVGKVDGCCVRNLRPRNIRESFLDSTVKEMKKERGKQ